MSKPINGKELIEAQRTLDLHTFKLKGIDYKISAERRIMALLVELHELANETKSFKFGVNKPYGDSEKILGEYVDVIHFILSIFSAREEEIVGVVARPNLKIKEPEELSSFFLELVTEFCDIVRKMFEVKNKTGMSVDTQDKEVCQLLTSGAQKAIDLSSYLGFTGDQVVKAYWNKGNINMARQNSGKY